MYFTAILEIVQMKQNIYPEVTVTIKPYCTQILSSLQQEGTTAVPLP